MNLEDTIAAISTPPGIGGIAIVRVSGSRTCEVLERVFRPRDGSVAARSIADHAVVYGHIVRKGRAVDEVLVTVMRKPRSYTREDMAEIGCHGGFTASRKVLEAFLEAGARCAEPGEFTLRAFINGRIDLSQARAVLDAVHSRTEASLRLAMGKLDGALSRRVAEVREDIVRLLANAEADIDFPGEEHVRVSGEALAGKVKAILARTEELLESGVSGRLYFDGVSAVIVGRTNVGKSSVLNRLLREERALISPVPGTTRDFLEGTVNVRGIPVRIIDTAGIRKTERSIERMGVEKALSWMKKAEMNILVLDGSRRLHADDRRLLDGIQAKPYVICVNKSDLPRRAGTRDVERRFPAGRIVSVSAKTGRGIEELEEKIYNVIQSGQAGRTVEDVYVSDREEQVLRDVVAALGRAVEVSGEPARAELFAEELRRALGAIDRVTGRGVDGEILARIFSQFCIGK